MPTYEYECQHCHHRFEKFQSITAPRLRQCPKCRHKVERVLGTGAGIIFKGSGFYETDYRSANYRKGAKADSDAGVAKTDSKTSGSSSGSEKK